MGSARNAELEGSVIGDDGQEGPQDARGIAQLIRGPLQKAVYL